MGNVMFSTVMICKRQMDDGSWQWQACVSRTEDGKRRQLRKKGIDCDPQKGAETGSGGAFKHQEKVPDKQCPTSGNGVIVSL